MSKNSPLCISKPFVKWAGGKGQLLGEIRKKYPANLGRGINKYAEPFVGGGAVLFDVLNNCTLDAVYISDANRELIHTYSTIKSSVDGLIDVLFEIENEYLSANTDTRKEIYYNKRDRFNSLKSSNDKSLELAALFIFLNRTCFNGLYRVNAKGGFNVPQGSYKNPSICDAVNLRSVSEKLRAVEIVCGDYKLASDFIDASTFAYFDPPYRPLTQTANFTAYAQNGFDDNAQTELASFIDGMSERGAYIVASNSDPKNVDEQDDFFDKLYAAHKISRIQASRAINSNGAKRGKVGELLIANGR
ncbi:MAG: DNA adenine methylase [Defluviitaleaceae bacterium]|nr:DNA adenine methylase [Defluviitaleaceae bacterium]